MKLRDADQVKVGDVFINCLRFNMLRVRAISGDDVGISPGARMERVYRKWVV
jgi:hypothetical protein